MTGWVKWHGNYDDPTSTFSQRLIAVRRRIAEAFDRSPAGAIRVASMCAGDGRDTPSAWACWSIIRARDVSGRLVELDPQLAENARASASSTIEVVCGDAGNSNAYEGAVPVNLLLFPFCT